MITKENGGGVLTVKGNIVYSDVRCLRFVTALLDCPWVIFVLAFEFVATSLLGWLLDVHLPEK